VEPGLACLGGNGHDSVEVFWQAVDKARQRRSRIVQRLNVPKCTPRASSLAAALLDGLSEQPAGHSASVGGLGQGVVSDVVISFVNELLGEEEKEQICVQAIQLWSGVVDSDAGHIIVLSLSPFPEWDNSGCCLGGGSGLCLSGSN